MTTLNSLLFDDHAINLALSALAPSIENAHVVWHCPRGMAEGCFELRDRGRRMLVEITCWPADKHYILTTGKEPSQLKLTGEQLRIAQVLGVKPSDAQDWMNAGGVALVSS